MKCKKEKKMKCKKEKKTRAIRKVSEYDERKQSRARYGGTKNPKKPSAARDAQRVAKPAGWRVSKSGKYYFENRSNRSDTSADVKKAKAYARSKAKKAAKKTSVKKNSTKTHQSSKKPWISPFA